MGILFKRYQAQKNKQPSMQPNLETILASIALIPWYLVVGKRLRGQWGTLILIAGPK
jgi:hypothetical protein